MTDNWINRIIEHGVKPADQFAANPRNARTHPMHQREATEASLAKLGWIAPVIENRRTGYLVDGHERVMEALLLNQPVPYVVVDLSEEEEAFALATFDPITSLATYDAELLDGLLREVNTDSPAIQQMLAELAADTGVVPPNNPYDEWVGMPEFEQESINTYHSINVHFNDQEDLDRFAQLVQQTVTKQTRYIYYPKQEKENLKRYQVVDES